MRSYDWDDFVESTLRDGRLENEISEKLNEYYRVKVRVPTIYLDITPRTVSSIYSYNPDAKSVKCVTSPSDEDSMISIRVVVEVTVKEKYDVNEYSGDIKEYADACQDAFDDINAAVFSAVMTFLEDNGIPLQASCSCTKGDAWSLTAIKNTDDTIRFVVTNNIRGK